MGGPRQSVLKDPLWHANRLNRFLDRTTGPVLKLADRAHAKTSQEPPQAPREEREAEPPTPTRSEAPRAPSDGWENVTARVRDEPSEWENVTARVKDEAGE
jgi:hypothetical protein